MCFIFLDQAVDAVQHCRHLLDFVNNVALCPWVCLDNLFDPLRVCNMISKCSVVQQVYQVGFRKSFLKPGGFACTSWAENKEAISRSVKKSFSEFFHRYPQLVATRLTLQVKIESQFYPIGLKMQTIFYLYEAGVFSGMHKKSLIKIQRNDAYNAYTWDELFRVQFRSYKLGRLNHICKFSLNLPAIKHAQAAVRCGHQALFIDVIQGLAQSSGYLFD